MLFTTTIITVQICALCAKISSLQSHWVAQSLLQLLSASKTYLKMFLTIGILLPLSGFWTTKQMWHGTTFGIMEEWIILKTFISGETISSFTRSLYKQFTFLGWTILHYSQLVKLSLSFGLILKVVFIPGLLLMNRGTPIITGCGLIMIGRWLFILHQQQLWMVMQEKLPLLNSINPPLG